MFLSSLPMLSIENFDHNKQGDNYCEQLTFSDAINIQGFEKANPIKQVKLINLMAIDN